MKKNPSGNTLPRLGQLSRETAVGLRQFECKYRGAARSEYNLNIRFRVDHRKEKFTIPIVFHNVKGYDTHHFIVCGLGSENEKFRCIARITRSFITNKSNSLKLIDLLVSE